ncbi:MAG: NAD(P)-dependent oxidoreductase [Thaumarchaeota archaeon]|nr:NAD(P)-dependent oxidoreductase [Nitrososphaerota archaeon]
MGVLVTGTGGLGSYIARHFVSQGGSVSLYGTARQTDAIKQIVDLRKTKIFKGDILDADGLADAVKQSEADRIIHTAGPRATQTRKDPKHCVRVHIQGTLNVLETARKLDLNRVIFSSTGSVYLATKKGQQARGPTIKEDDVLVPMDHEDVYATAKVNCEYLGFNYAKTYGFGFIPLRIAHVYGYWPGDMGRGVVVSDMVRACVMNNSLEVDEQIAEWTYYNDLAEEHAVAAYSQNVKIGAINAGSGKIASLKDVVDILKKYFKTINLKVSQEAKTSRSTPSDMSRAKEVLGFVPKYDLQRSVDDLIKIWKKKLGK